MEVRLLKMLRVIASFGWQSFDNQDRRDEIEAALANEGFWDFEVTRMFEWLAQLREEPDFERQLDVLLEAASVGKGGYNTTVNLSERAHSFLTSVRDLGLIDEAMEEEIYNRLMMQSGQELEFEDVRKIAATVIFDRQFRSGEEYYGIFEEEWKLLFN